MNTSQRRLFEFSESEEHIHTNYATILDVQELEENKNTARPFVKWVGGKRSIMDTLLANIPERFNHYYEPFIGGGALFFELHKQLSSATLSDTNLDLILTYRVIRNDINLLINRLEEHARRHSKKYYYQVRTKHNKSKTLGEDNAIDRAARFIYLNKTCFNGLWRVNSKGEFNVPIGSYKNPSIVQEARLKACHDALQNVNLRWYNIDEWYKFDDTKAQAGDFVYLDPPYHPTDDTSFTKYSRFDFTESDQKKLRDFVIDLHQRGVFIMLSNSSTKFIHDIYSNNYFNIINVQAPRMVNCKPNGRGVVNEVLITNY